MRPVIALLLLPALTAGVVVLPPVSLPAASAAPVPVTPAVRELAVAGIDQVALTRSPQPEDEHVTASVVGGEAARKAQSDEPHLTPVAVTKQIGTGTFSALGVTWAPDEAIDEVAVQVRTRAAGQWSPWRDLDVQLNSGSDASSREGQGARAGSDLLFVGPSDAVQVRVDSGEIRPRGLRVSLIDPGGSSADGATTGGRSTGSRALLGAAAVTGAAASPPYVSREEWGADESLRHCSPYPASTLKGAILHTTATSNDYTPEQSPAVMRAMYAYHTTSLGWCDIGYNFLVDKYGTLFEGRSGGVDKAIVGSHTGGFNTHTVGVSMIGNHDLAAPTPAMLRMVERVFAWKLSSHGLDPLGTTEYTSRGGSATKYPSGTVVTQHVISGHRDYSSKSCPGDYAYPLLPQIRSNVAALIAGGTLVPAPAPAAGAETAAPAADLGTPVPPAPVSAPPTAPDPVALPAATTTSASLSVRHVRYGSSLLLSGRVAAGAIGVANKPVHVFVRRTGTTSWRRMTTVPTDGNGFFRLTHRPTVNTTYALRFRGDAAHAASGRDTAVAVATAVSAAFTATTVAPRHPVVLRGAVRTPHAGQRVYAQSLVNGRWKTVTSATIGPSGSYAMRLRWVTRGVRFYRVVKPADRDHVTGVSPVRKVTVR